MIFRPFALPEFWKCYSKLPPEAQKTADNKFALFEQNPFHASLGLEQKGEVWTADVGRSYRAIAYREDDDFHWFWIESHEAYNNVLRRWK